MSGIRLMTQWDTVDKKTGLVIPGEAVPGHSWVKGAAQIFSMRLNNLDFPDLVKDTAGATFTLDKDYGASTGWGMVVDAASGDDTHGIQVGTGTTAVAKANHQLNTKIAHGTGSGQLEYKAVVVGPTHGISGGYRVTVSRQFDNNSGATITVQECGMVWTCQDTSLVQKYVLVLHDLQVQAILNTESKIFKYHLDFLV